MPAKRELINTGKDKRFVRRSKTGKFKESDDVGRSLASDRRTKAKTAAKSGQGDKGDRKPTARKATKKKKKQKAKTPAHSRRGSLKPSV